MYDKNTNHSFKSDIYEVGLYELINNNKVLVSKTQTDVEMNFSFNALPDGDYYIIAVENSIKNPSDDFSKNKFSIYIRVLRL